MKRLVLDLRGNPGGQLDQAIRMANHFLHKGMMIVATHGRIANSDQDYRATTDGDYTELPMIMLVNRNSASASEIVTGALQVHRRHPDPRRQPAPALQLQRPDQVDALLFGQDDRLAGPLDAGQGAIERIRGHLGGRQFLQEGAADFFDD